MQLQNQVLQQQADLRNGRLRRGAEGELRRRSEGIVSVGRPPKTFLVFQIPHRR